LRETRSVLSGVGVSTREEVEAVLPALREGIVVTLASWVTEPLETFEIHVFGADDDDDVYHNGYHDGTPDLIQAFSSMRRQFLLAWTMCRIRKGVEVDHGGLANYSTTHVLHPSLLDEFGNHVLRTLDHKPSVALFHLHGMLCPPSLSIGKIDHPYIPVEDVASDIDRLAGRTLLVAMPVCYSAQLADAFSTCEGIECVYAPNESDVGENEVTFVVRSLGELIRSIGYLEIMDRADF
ncbi:uncharacterized protein METZ01_LOCUS423756, partial [marine metagenome]